MLRSMSPKHYNKIPFSSSMIELIYTILVGIIMMIICSSFWELANKYFIFDHTAYGVNLVQYLFVKVSRFCEYKFMNIRSWADIVRFTYCMAVYYILPLSVTAKLCTFYQSLLNDCLNSVCRVIGMIFITIILLSVCIGILCDMLTVLHVVQMTGDSLGYVFGTMVN